MYGIDHSGQTVPIVFLTSSREFVVDSYEVKALNYLIKPVDAAKLFLLLDDFLKTFDFADVDYLEAETQNKQVLIHLSNDRTITVGELFSKCVEIFSTKNGFCCCHRSYIVNLSNVERFSKTEVITVHNALIPISRGSYTAVNGTASQYVPYPPISSPYPPPA